MTASWPGRGARWWLALLSLLCSLAAVLPPSGAEADRSRAASTSRARRGRARRPPRRAPRPRITAAQRRQIRRWHQRADRSEVQVWQRQDPPPLVFRALHVPERFALVPASTDGGFDAEDLALAEQAFTYRIDGSRHEVHPRLLELVYRAVRHFRAPYVTVVSGYRSGNPSSRHGQGRAIDLVLPGVSDRRLAAYLRPQGYVGVGIYPNSGFVHLDVRARSYFWADASGPGQRNRERQIMRTLGPRFDRIARALGAEPVADHVEAPDEEPESEEQPLEPETLVAVADGEPAPSEPASDAAAPPGAP